MRVPRPPPEEDARRRRALLDWVLEEAGRGGVEALLRERNSSEVTPLFTACHCACQ